MSRIAEDQLFQGIGAVPHHSFRWTSNSDDNPYFGYLALADRFIVTATEDVAGTTIVTDANATFPEGVDLNGADFEVTSGTGSGTTAS